MRCFIVGNKKKELALELSKVQRECKDKKIPVMIVLEGLSVIDKGNVINEIIEELDPRGFQVIASHKLPKDTHMPFLWKYWTCMPEKGKFHIYDKNWHGECLRNRKVSREERLKSIEHIENFEKQLIEDGVVVIKIFLYCEKEQFNLEKIRKDKHKEFFSKEYKKEKNRWNRWIQDTSFSFCNWHIVDVSKGQGKELILKHIMEKCKQGMEKEKTREEKFILAEEDEIKYDIKRIKELCLAKINLNKTVEKKYYKKQVKTLQKKLQKLQLQMKEKKLSLVIVLEGWDAAGKGGAIKRITKCLDPRSYEVVPISAPNDLERSHHYLWRFWRHIPKPGYITIFDRSWYGRVMVEPIEGLCTREQWKRAYKEINQMEQQWQEKNRVILKFWLQIDKEEQKERFLARKNNPDKAWKLTKEDWRNREKWDLYEVMVNKMLEKTSTIISPWIIVEANSKYYARLKILENIVYQLEEQLWRN